MKRVFPLICGGKTKISPQTLAVKNKFSGETIADISLADKDIINDAFEQAQRAAPAMAALRPHEKANLLVKLHGIVSKNAKELAELISAEAGKPIGGSEIEVARSLGTLGEAAREAALGYPEGSWRETSSEAGRYSLLNRRFPIGVASFISPFNFPLNLVMHKIAPAIAAGCPFVLKPSEQSPLSAVRLGEMLTEIGLPEGAASILPCGHEDAHIFSTHPHIKLISFTGSAHVGWKIKEAAPKKRVVLELGGNAACIVEPDADLAEAANRIVFGAYFYAGQSCISVQRILAHESIYDDLVSRIVSGAAEINKAHGDPSDPKTRMGPLISEKEAIRVDEWVQEAVKKGAKVEVGGTRNKQFFDATLLSGVPHDAMLWKEEVFGPVALIEKYSNYTEAITLSNNSRYGLQTGVFTNDLRKAHYAFENLDVGGVVIGDVPTARIDSQSYGGVKDSGCGREGIRYAIEDMTEPRVMLLKNL